MSLLRTLALTTLLATFGAVSTSHAADRLVIKGGGFGHGVGMSQYGAKGFADNGSTYRQILGHYYTGTALGRLGETPTVRVLLQSRSAVTFTGASQAGERRLTPGKTYRATSTVSGQVVLRSSSGRRLRTMGAPLRVVGAGGNPVRLAGGQNSGLYRGVLELQPRAVGGLQVVNALGLEDYVRGVVAGESPSSWHPEALKAQAVAARTYAITTNKPGDGFDHYADVRSQVYGGVRLETATTDAAIAATKGEVVTYQGKPVTTYFFSTSGGKTENVENSLGGDPKPWLKSVDDPYDKVSPRHKWTLRMSLTEARRKLGAGLVKGSLRGIEVIERGVSPRIKRAEIVGSAGRTSVTGATLRRELGLYDTWATFTTVDTKASASRTTYTAFGNLPARTGVISGTVIGPKRGTKLVVERRNRAGLWLVETRATVGKRGRYRAGVGRAGTYRVTVNGTSGPVVKL